MERKVVGVAEEEIQISDLELTKQYKRELENWREFLYYLDTLLAWDKPFYPGIIATFITVVFIILWYFEPSILTSVSLIGIIICILDYAVPVLSSRFFDADKWTGIQQRKFEDICQKLAQAKRGFQNAWCMLTIYKEKYPKMYFVGVVAALVIVAWIGNLVNNLFLSYILSRYTVGEFLEETPHTVTTLEAKLRFRNLEYRNTVDLRLDEEMVDARTINVVKMPFCNLKKKF